MTSGYTHTEPFDEGYLKVSEIHTLYYHQYGSPNGKPVVFLHGGPGGGSTLNHTAFFNPNIYHAVLFDQRGAGKSRPVAELRENTTQLLIQDIETLREKLGIKKWHMVFGGSWGSTLALAYAEAHPEATGSLVLRGVFFGEKEEAESMVQGKLAGQLYPEEWENFINYLPEGKRHNALQAYAEIITGEDRKKAAEAACVWNKWELTVSKLVGGSEDKAFENDDWNIQHASMECHYFMNNSFMEGDALFQGLGTLKGIPMSIVQGRYDIVCPPAAAWRLHKALPESRLFWSPDAGHSATEPNTLKKLVEVCDEYGKQDFHL